MCLNLCFLILFVNYFMPVSLVTVLAIVWTVVSLRYAVINNKVKEGEYLSTLKTMAANFQLVRGTGIHTHRHTQIMADSERGLAIRG